MNIYRLTPVHIDYAGWKYSAYKGDVVVRSESEARARALASIEFSLFAAIVPGQETVGSPWDQESIVSCQKETGDEFNHDGPPEILFPKDEYRIPSDEQEA